MANRQTRSSSISMPRTLSTSTPTRNIESIMSIPFIAGTARPRRSSVIQRPAADEHRGLGISQGIRGPASHATAASSSTRPTTRSLTHTSAIPPRGLTQSQSTFEPRVIRADSIRTSLSMETPCLPSSSTSPTRTRRPSAPGVRPPNTHPHPSVPNLSPPPQVVLSFPRPAYLDHSALRHLIQSEYPPSLPPSRSYGFGHELPSAPLLPFRTLSSPTDSEEESNVTPPRDLGPPPVPAPQMSASSVDNIQWLPTRWSDQIRHHSLTRSPDGRDLHFHGPSCNGEKDAAAARTDRFVPPACGIYYYEVTVLSKGQKGHISIGFAGRDVSLSRLPGWEKDSWGYHGDDGFSFAADRMGVPYGPTFGAGDTIGCGIDFSQNKVFYTKNGIPLGLVFENVGKDCDIFPSVGFRHTDDVIRVNFGQEPFIFDIECHVQQQRNQAWSKIMSTSLQWPFVKDSTSNNKENKEEIVKGKLPTNEEELKVPINQIVLSYLAHHGYAKTARAFEAQCERRGGISTSESKSHPPDSSGSASSTRAPIRVTDDHIMDMEDVSDSARATPMNGVRSGMHEGDIELRTRIVHCIIAGDIDAALAETEKYHPAVLEQDEGLMKFKLKCRKFVELILEAAEMRKKMRLRADELETPFEDEEGRLDLGNGKGKGTSADGAMDVDDDASTPISFYGASSGSTAIPIRTKRKHSVSSLNGSGWSGNSGPAISQYDNALTKAIQYGQALQVDYGADTRPEVKAIFKKTFGIVAYEDPLEAGGETAEVAGQESRVVLANEMNQAILKSQGQPTHPALESIYRQAAACVVQLGLMGVGAAAFADMPKEFLDA